MEVYLGVAHLGRVKFNIRFHIKKQLVFFDDIFDFSPLGISMHVTIIQKFFTWINCIEIQVGAKM